MFLPAGQGGSSAVEASSGWPAHRRSSSTLSLQLRIYTNSSDKLTGKCTSIDSCMFMVKNMSFIHWNMHVHSHTPADGASSLIACQLVLLSLRLAQLHLLHAHRLVRQTHQRATVHLTALGPPQGDAPDQGLKVPARSIRCVNIWISVVWYDK